MRSIFDKVDVFVRKSIPFLRFVSSALEIGFTLLVKSVEIAEHFFLWVIILRARNAKRWF